MMINKLKCILNLGLASMLSLTFIFGTTINAYSEENKAGNETDLVVLEDTNILEVNEINGTSASSLESLFTENRNVGAKLSNVTLSYNDKLFITGTLAYENEVIDFESSGDLYKNEKTENAGMFDNLILGDMSDFNNIHFVQLRIDKDKSYILIVMQDVNTKQLMQFQIPIDIGTFGTIYNSHENHLSGNDLENKIVELYSIAANLIDKDSPPIFL